MSSRPRAAAPRSSPSWSTRQCRAYEGRVSDGVIRESRRGGGSGPDRPIYLQANLVVDGQKMAHVVERVYLNAGSIRDTIRNDLGFAT